MRKTHFKWVEKINKSKSKGKWMKMEMRNGVRLGCALFLLRLFCLKYSSGCLYLPACERMHRECLKKVEVNGNDDMISVFIWCIIPKHPWLKRWFGCHVWLYIFMWIDFIASSSEIRVSLHFIIFMNGMESHFDTHKMREEQKGRATNFNTAS